MKTLKFQLFENLINQGIKAHYERSHDYSLLDDRIYIGDIDIQLSRGYVTIWNTKDDKMRIIWDNPMNKKNINIISDYIVNLIKNQ